MCTFHSITNFDCFIIRSQISIFLWHPDLYLSCIVLTTISEWAHENLIEMFRSIEKFGNPLLLNTGIMRDVRPSKCEYGSLLEAFEFCEMKKIIKLKTDLHTT